MSDPIVLYTNPQSRGRIARWMLEEVGVPYEAQVLEYGTSMKAPEFLAVNPMGKVPALRHGDVVVTEVPAICAYLADAFPEAGLAPPPLQRGDYYRWLFFTAGPLEQAVTLRNLEFTPPPDKEMMVGFGTFDGVVRAIDGLLADRTYVVGEAFTAADVVLGAYLGWYTQWKIIEATPAIGAYVERVQARPAFVAASEKDDALAG